MTFNEAIVKAQEMQKELLELNRELESKKQLYKAFTKEHFGLADGEPIDVLEIVKAIKLVGSKGD